MKLLKSKDVVKALIEETELTLKEAHDSELKTIQSLYLGLLWCQKEILEKEMAELNIPQPPPVRQVNFSTGEGVKEK